jgi:hypothetical protein
MSRLKKIVLAISAVVALIIPAGISQMAITANAATPSCGNGCVNPLTREWGRHIVMDAIGGGFGVQHQRMILFRFTQDPAEDFVYSFQGTVNDLFADGLVSAAVKLHYGNDPAFELEYSPLGLDSNLCVGSWLTHPVAGNILRLEPCGVAANTLWIVHDFGVNGNNPGFGTIIAGTTTNFSHPLVWTYRNQNSPFDLPRESINLDPQQTFSNGVHPNGQQWGARFGPA